MSTMAPDICTTEKISVNGLSNIVNSFFLLCKITQNYTHRENNRREESKYLGVKNSQLA